MWLIEPRKLYLIREADYLCYLAATCAFLLAALLMVALLLDVALDTGLFIDRAAFADDKLILPIVFSRIFGPTAFAILVLFYLRIRLALDIAKDQIPIVINGRLLVGHSLTRCTAWSVFGIVTSLLFIFCSHAVATYPVVHYGIRSSTFFVIFAEAVVLLVIARFSSLLISCALILEKSIRFFPAVQADLRRHIAEMRGTQ